MTDNKEIGLRIESRRKQLGLTLDEIAIQVGVARSTIQRYEKGSINSVKLPVLDSIANVLKVNASWIACKSDQMDILEIEKPATVAGDELSESKLALIDAIKTMDDSQVIALKAIVDSILQLRGK